MMSRTQALCCKSAHPPRPCAPRASQALMALLSRQNSHRCSWMPLGAPACVGGAAAGQR